MENLSKALKLLVNKKIEDNRRFDRCLVLNVQDACDVLDINYKTLHKLVPQLIHCSNKNTVRWNFISLSFYIMLSMNKESDILSVTQINDTKKVLQFVVGLGILKNLIPGIGVDLKLRMKNLDKIPVDNHTVKDQYYLIVGTVKGLLLCLKYDALHTNIMSKHFCDLLTALLQLVYAPVVKPDKANYAEGFIMDSKFYAEIQKNKLLFKIELDELLNTTHPPMIMRELMLLGNEKCPQWFKKSVFTILSSRVQGPNGVESVIRAMMEVNGETGLKWRQYDILMKLLMKSPTCVTYEEGYYDNICSQLIQLKNKRTLQGNTIVHYQKIIALCTKYLYEHKTAMCTKKLLSVHLSSFIKYTNNSADDITNGIVTDEISTDVAILHSCFIESKDFNCLPIKLLKPVLKVLFYLYSVVYKSELRDIKSELSDLLLKYVSSGDEDEQRESFECFLFTNEISDVFELRSNFEFKIKVEERYDIEVVITGDNVKIGPFVLSECVLTLFELNIGKNLIVPFVTYLINISMKNQELSRLSSVDFSKLDEQELLVTNKITEYKIVVYKLLSTLIENQNVCNHIKSNPGKILAFAVNLLKSKINKQIHMLKNEDSEEFQSLFVLVMLINIIVSSSAKYLKEDEDLKSHLKLISLQTTSFELRMVINSIFCMNLSNEDEESSSKRGDSRFVQALEDVESQHLPIRAHGLMSLTKLIQEGDEIACSSKQYIFHLCKDYLDHEDSYLYLSAIHLLAILGEKFPNLVLETLTDQYTNADKSYELRMKVGEVLLRIIRSLGEKSEEFKAIFLNTFLTGARDEDHLMRASSLSNLGEICRVLGYKLGSIVTEVLECIHTIIANDSAAEARRAAVSVIRMIFVGLQQEAILFLKEQILPIYRTLKRIYTSDPDDVTKLQAQLALEELNEIMRGFIMPKGQLKNDFAMLK